MSEEHPNVTVAKFSFKQAIIVAGITGATTLGGTLLTLRSGGNESAPPDSGISPLELCQNEKDQLANSLSRAIAFSSLADISNRYFDKEHDEDQIKGSIRTLVNVNEQYELEKKHFTYKLFQLKKLMLVNGGNINTRVSNADKKACIIIQELLKGIEFHRGGVDGDVQSTRFAVENFQNTLNIYTPGYFEKENLGIVGKKTFNAILERYEKSD